MIDEIVPEPLGGAHRNPEIAIDTLAQHIDNALKGLSLLEGGVLPGPLFKHAVDGLGRDGFNRVVFVVAQYFLVSMTLNAFDVPAEEP